MSQLLIDAACTNKPAWVVKGETLDFSYIDDVADGFVKAILMSEANHETYNISRGVAKTAVEFAEILKNYFPNFEYDVRQPVAQQVYRGPQDIQKVRIDLDFDPKYSIELGIKKILHLVEEYQFYK